MSLYKSVLSYFEKIRNNKINSKEQKTIMEPADKNNISFFETLIDTIPTPIFYKDIEGVYQHCNTAFAENLGKKKEEIIGHTIYDICDKKNADLYNQKDMALIENEINQVYEAEVNCKDGTMQHVIFDRAVLRNNEGEVIGMVGAMFDITNSKKDEKRINRLMKIKEAMLKVNQAIIGTLKLDEIFELIMEKVCQTMAHADLASILVLNEAGNLKIAANKGYDKEKAKIFNLPLNEAFIWEETQGNIVKSVVINDIQGKYIDKTPDLLENMPGIIVKSTISAPIIIDGKLYGLVNIDSRDNYVYDEEDIEVMEYMRSQIATAISKHNLYEETIYLYRHDKLTGLYNRRYFEELFNICIDKSIRYQEHFSLVIFDLNDLKSVNDAYGHLAGDAFIKSFVERLTAHARTSDILARFGGDEFIALFYDISEADLNMKIEQLYADFSKNKIQFENIVIRNSFSFGISIFDQDSIGYNELIKLADKRMYENKRKMKNNHDYYGKL